MDAPFTLGPYAARNCPVRVQNRFDPTIPPVDEAPTVDPTSATETHRIVVLNELADHARAKGFRVIDLRDCERIERLDATQAAVTEGAAVIIAPELPPDWAGHRSGSPDALSRHGVTAHGTPAYAPVQVKRHLVLNPQRYLDPTQRVSYFSDPLLEKSVRIDQLHRGGQIAADLIQLSHYWRHLESIGWAAASPRIGGLIGVDRLTTSNDPDCVLRCIVWIDLSLRSIPTISKTRPGKQRLRSPLDRYDHEFGFRVKLAHAAAQRTDGDAPPTVRPIHISECSHCPWWTTCALQLDPGDLSLAIDKSPLDAQEIRALRSLGVLSVTNLVAADMTTLLQEYLPLVPHRPDADQRLLLARHRAEMLANGIMLERIGTEPPQVPRAALEIDFDIETSRDDHVYLWGFLLSKPGSAEPPEYRPFARFGQLGSATECDLAAVALGWLAELLDANPDSIVYHYSEYETRHIARFSQLVAAGKLLAMPQRFCDLFPIIRANYFGVHGIGLKQIALHGAGFHWRDSNPGGLASQSWFEEAVQNPDEQVRAVMAQRLLEYNEDDTRATLALREWLSGGGATN